MVKRRRRPREFALNKLRIVVVFERWPPPPTPPTADDSI
uniref:Uncharacterized protein n=1 Tax=Schistosoma curassoni TaxID=6186 RepID=A0A183JI77_9TREM